MDSHKKVTVELTRETIAWFTLFPLMIFLLWSIKDLVFSLLIGFILMSALKPGVTFLVHKKVPRSVAALVIYVLFLFVFVYLISLIIPPIIVETTSFLKNLPHIIDSLNPNVSKWVDLDTATQYIPNVTNHLFDFISGVFSNTLFVISTLFFGFYLLLEENLISKVLAKYLHEKKVSKITHVLLLAEERMSSWFWGELTLMLVVGIFTFIGLNIIGLKYALPLAVLAGLFEVIPNIGPIISSIPAIIIGATNSYFSAFSAGALYLIVQQLENNLIVPIIMKRAVGINPIITLIVLLLGGRLGGVLGVLLSIPLYLFIDTVIREGFFHKETDK